MYGTQIFLTMTDSFLRKYIKQTKTSQIVFVLAHVLHSG